MTRSGTRRRLAPGIYQDDTGCEAIVGKSHGHPQVSRRFPLVTPIGVMQRWQLTTKAARVAGPAPSGGTLAADAPRYLATLPAGSNARQKAEIEVRHWLSTPLTTRRRDDISRADVKAQMAQWEAGGAAASTLNHRLRILRALYRELDGDDAPNPTQGIRKRKEPEREPRAVPLDVARGILAYIRPGCATRIRLGVMLTTGLPHAQLVRLARRDVDWSGRFYARPRRKGAGTAGTWLKLLPAAVEALRAYDAKNLWGRPFSTASMRMAFRRAVAAYTAAHPDVQLPPHLHPYDLRHAFLTAIYAASGDQRAAQELGQHADIRTTRRYTLGAVSARAEAAIAALALVTRWHQTGDDSEKEAVSSHAPVAQLDRAFASGAKGETAQTPHKPSTSSDSCGWPTGWHAGPKG